MLDLKATLSKYKDDTLSLINCLESEDYDALEGLMNDRQALIDTMNSSGFDREQFTMLCKEYDIMRLDSKIHAIMISRMSQIKAELKKIGLNKNVNNNYNMKMSVDSIFFNKKI